MLHTLKNIILWRYGRTTLQYDVLCVLILAFVFLTPQTWFERGELMRAASHPNSPATVTIVAPPDSSADSFDSNYIERSVRSLPGRLGARVKSARPIHDASGKVILYEVDLE